MMILGSRLFAGVFATSVLLAGSALAADPGVMTEPPVAASDWIVQVTPYLWASGIDGNISPFQRAPTVGVDVPFSEIWDNLNFGGFMSVWARRDRFVFSGDLMYVNLSDTDTVGIPNLPDFPGGAIDASLDTVQFYAALEGGYRVVDTPEFTLDALAGGRFWYISNDVTLSYAGYSISRGADFTWIDPLIAARAFYNITDKLSVMGHADIGGFGVGSELTWSVLGTVNYVFNDNWSVSAGYKYLSVDYDDDGYVFDVDMSGPVLGFTYRFN